MSAIPIVKPPAQAGGDFSPNRDSSPDRDSSPKKLMVAALVALPAIIFFSILSLEVVNLPDADDYYSVLEFMNHMSGVHGFTAKFFYCAVAQYAEYKLVVEHAIVWLQVALLGHVDFRVLSVIGDAFVLLLMLVLWKMFLPGRADTTTRLMLFVPVSWVVFQLQYVELLDFPMVSLANVPVLVFSLGAMFLLTRNTRATYLAALCCLILAIASFGNGFVLVPVGVLILMVNRRYLWIAGWMAVSSGCVVAYACRYTVQPVQGLAHSSILSFVLGRVLYIFTFLGSAAAFPLRNGYVGFGVLLCPMVGLGLYIFFFAVARRGYFRRNPLIGYCFLFLFITAVVVACGRTDNGLLSAYSSRYGIYSTLLFVFAWFAFAEEYVLPQTSTKLRISPAEAATLAILFSLAMDVMGWRYMVDRNRELADGIAAFERSTSVGPVLPLPGDHPWRKGLIKDAPAILEKSEELGIYEPPKL